MPFVLLDTNVHSEAISSTMVQISNQNYPIGQPNVALRYTDASSLKEKGAGSNTYNATTANQHQLYPSGSRVASRLRPMDWAVHVHITIQNPITGLNPYTNISLVS